MERLRILAQLIVKRDFAKPISDTFDFLIEHGATSKDQLCSGLKLKVKPVQRILQIMLQHRLATSNANKKDTSYYVTEANYRLVTMRLLFADFYFDFQERWEKIATETPGVLLEVALPLGNLIMDLLFKHTYANKTKFMHVVDQLHANPNYFDQPLKFATFNEALVAAKLEPMAVPIVSDDAPEDEDDVLFEVTLSSSPDVNNVMNHLIDKKFIEEISGLVRINFGHFLQISRNKLIVKYSKNWFDSATAQTVQETFAAVDDDDYFFDQTIDTATSSYRYDDYLQANLEDRKLTCGKLEAFLERDMVLHLIRERFGVVAVRMFTILQRAKHLEEDALYAEALVPSDSAGHKLAAMVEFGFVETREVVKSSPKFFNGKRQKVSISTAVFGVNWARSVANAIDEMFAAAMNAQLKLQFEAERIGGLRNEGEGGIKRPWTTEEQKLIDNFDRMRIRLESATIQSLTNAFVLQFVFDRSSKKSQA